MPHRAPEAHRHRQLDAAVRDARRGELVGLVESAFGRGLVGRHAERAYRCADHRGQRVLRSGHFGQAGGTRAPALRDVGDDGLRRAVVQPRRDAAVGVQPGREAGHAGRAVEVVRGVLVARPEALHRHAGHGPGHLRGQRDEVGVQPAAETAADEHGVHPHLLVGQAERAGHHAAGNVGHLRRNPDLGRRGVGAHGAVHRLQRLMRQIRCAVGGLHGLRRDGECGLRIARFDVRKAVVAVQCRSERACHVGTAGRGRSAFVPGDCTGRRGQ